MIAQSTNHPRCGGHDRQESMAITITVYHVGAQPNTQKLHTVAGSYPPTCDHARWLLLLECEQADMEATTRAHG